MVKSMADGWRDDKRTRTNKPLSAARVFFGQENYLWLK
jgi:hypothetical protein